MTQASWAGIVVTAALLAYACTWLWVAYAVAPKPYQYEKFCLREEMLYSGWCSVPLDLDDPVARMIWMREGRDV